MYGLVALTSAPLSLTMETPYFPKGGLYVSARGRQTALTLPWPDPSDQRAPHLALYR
jgi:hypothetical protein